MLNKISLFLQGSGASYGGKGGDSSDGSEPSVVQLGSLYTGNLFGSGGGSGSDPVVDLGGTGGGNLVVEAESFTLSGTVSASGAAGVGGGGGGAAGSVTVTATDLFTGIGAVKVSALISYV